MIAVLRVKYTNNTDPAAVPPDSVFANWLDPTIEHSLANYWFESGWGGFDLRSMVFPILQVTDPGKPSREDLVNGVIQQATAALAPKWEDFTVVLIWFAQQVDMFGVGPGKFTVPLPGGATKPVGVTVLDPFSPFDDQCQELGHAFGLMHELDAGGNDYRSPYSAMSARLYGDRNPEFARAFDARLPEGKPIIDPNDAFNGLPAYRVVGPALTPAQLYLNTWFGTSSHVVTVPAAYAQTPVTMKLHALDSARAQASNPQLRALAVIAPSPLNTRTFCIELRRQGGSYDQGIGGPDVPPGLVVHSLNPDGRVRYEGVLPLSSPNGNTDWTSVARLFTLRLLAVGPDNEFAEFQVLGGAFENLHNVRIDASSETAIDEPGEWESVDFEEPCVRGVFSSQAVRTSYTWSLFANSAGFDAPLYRWYLDGLLLVDSPAEQTVVLHPEMFIPTPPVGQSPSGGNFNHVPVQFAYQLTGNHLTLRLPIGYGNFTATVTAVAHADPNSDPVEVSADLRLTVRCLRYVWEKAYLDRLHHCYAWLDQVVDRQRPGLRVNPDDSHALGVPSEQLAEVLTVERAIQTSHRADPEQAAAMVDFLVQRYNVPRTVLLARLEREDQRP